MKKPSLKTILPEFPRIPHLPYKANAAPGDIIAGEEEVNELFTTLRLKVPVHEMFVEEKVDGANSAICLHEDNPIIRNRTHILNKGFHKDTPAKKQFLRIWNWFYENKAKFERLNEACGFSAGVYGEWLYALHGIRYDKLPSYFIAYDVYDWEQGRFLNTLEARYQLGVAGFDVVPLLLQGSFGIFDQQLEVLCNRGSQYSTTDLREGVVVKVCDDDKVLHRFKMIRSDFVQGCNWNEEELTKNKLAQ
jgi:atypical dual specificity phosphatase